MRQVASVIALLKSAIRLLETESSSISLAESFMRQHTRPSPGTTILYAELYRRFLDSLTTEEKRNWTKPKFGCAIRAAGYKTAEKTANKLHAIGVEWIN